MFSLALNNFVWFLSGGVVMALSIYVASWVTDLLIGDPE